MATTKNIQSVERAFSILEMFQSAGGEGLSLRDLSDRLDLNKSTVFGLVNTLVNMGYLQRDEHTQLYTLGYRFLSFSDTVKASSLLLRVVQPYLSELSRIYGETVHFAVEQRGKVIYLDKVTAPQSISINSQIGQENWMHCTGVGKCLLAHMSPAGINEVLAGPLPRMTDYTITDPVQLRAELEKIRACGYALDMEEVELGLSCVAVPIYDRHGRVCCAVSVSGLTPRIRTDLENGIADTMKKVAAEITQKL